ncbi:hypothetical protein NG697_12605 [Pseudarthrobacter sp. MDT3-26]|uniref:hypothetical protein n=1 Tax=Pseudarthrobacter raffinosi TaxID=2953651 RepID=UPI00208F64A9|nr:hypothetical protein [Pseudarthrobacter sp. MDT3-26]MCO4263752.1 hypothetical protein [Pseudarthrobacter sp. MDT3-26]
MSISATWEQTRHGLLLELAALPSEGDVVQWQRRLADAIIDAEGAKVATDMGEAKRHRHLLRVIADGLVHELLDEHTIRSLSRHPGKPASLLAQGADFDFVFEQASRLHSLGFIPIIADLTTLIGVGDIVGWSATGVVVLECKNRPAPLREATTGRLARQRQRGEQVETYLTTSTLDEGDSLRQAVTMSLPSPDWAAVTDLLERCEESSSGAAVYSLGQNDILVAATAQATPEQVMTLVLDFIESTSPTVVFYSELINTASYRFMAPSSYPVAGDRRWRLLEGELRLIRLIDMSAFAAELVHEGAVITLVPEQSAARLDLRIDVDGREYTRFTHQLAEFCLWMPVPLAAIRQTLIDYALTLVKERAAASGETADSPNLAAGDNFMYATVYRPESGR